MLEDLLVNYGLVPLAPKGREPEKNTGHCPIGIRDCPHENDECSKGYECKLNPELFPRCGRCGSTREKIDRGACKGLIANEDGTTRMCFLRW
jgi:hypothetical protein